MANYEKIERTAIRAVEEYIDECPKLEPIINKNDKSHIFDGDILIYNNVEHITKFYLTRIPVIIKCGIISSRKNYFLKREVIKSFKSEGGGIFFLVQMEEKTPKIFFSFLSVNYSDTLLADNRKQIGVELKEVPADYNQFEDEVINSLDKNKFNNENENHDTQYIKQSQEIIEKLIESITTIDKKELINLSLLESVSKFAKEDLTILNKKINDLLENDQNNLDKIIKPYLLFLLSNYYASNLRDLKKYDFAERFYKEAFLNASKLSYYSNFKNYDIQELDNLIDLYTRTNDLDAIEKTYLGVIDEYLKSNEINPLINIDSLASFYLKLADFYEDNNKHYKAACNYVNALNLYYFLVDSNEEVYFKKVTDVLWKLYEIHKRLRKIQDAKQDNTDALSFIKNQAIIDRAKLLAESAFLCKNNKDYKKAEVDYNESLKIFSKKEVKFQEANVMASLADIYVELGKIEEAKRLYDKSHRIFRRLDNEDISIKASYAKALFLYAKMFAKIANVEKANYYYKNALEMQESICDSNEYLADYLETIIAYICLNPYKKDSEEYFLKSLYFLSISAKKDQESSISLTNLIFYNAKDYIMIIRNNDNKDVIILEIEKTLTEIIKNYENLEKDVQDYYKEDILALLNHLAFSYNIFEKYQEAEIKYNELLEKRREIAKSNPEFDENVAFTLCDLGRLYYINLKRYEDAKSCYSEALDIFLRLSKDDVKQYLEEMTNIHFNLGNLARADNRKKDAEEEFRKALEGYQALNLNNSGKYDEKLAETFDNIAYFLSDDEARTKDAKEAVNRALQYYRLNNKNEEKTKQLTDILYRLEDQSLATNRLAVSAVKDYLNKVDKLNSEIYVNGKEILIDGNLWIIDRLREKESIPRNIPVSVKGSRSDNESIIIERKVLEFYLRMGGIVLFKVFVDQKPIIIRFALLSIDIIDNLLKKNANIVEINMQEVPADPKEFEKEIFDFDDKRYLKLIDIDDEIEVEKKKNNVRLEIANLVEEFNKMHKFIEENNDSGDYDELNTYLGIILHDIDYSTIGWHDKFIYYSQKILDLAIITLKDYDSVELLFLLGKYLHEQKQYHLVEDYYVKALTEYRKRQDDVNVSIVLNKLGNLYKDLTRYKEAEQEYLEALEIRRELAETNRDAFIGYMAQTLNNLAFLHAILNQFEKAEQEYLEALEIRRELAETNRDAYIGDVALTLDNLGELHRTLTRYEKAEQEYLEALEIRRALAETNRDAYIGDVALTLDNLGELHRTLTRYEEAEHEYQEALGIRRELAKTNRDAYIADVAFTLNNLSILHYNLYRFDEAEKEYNEALEIRRELAKTNRAVYIGDVALTLDNLANLHNTLNRYEEAEQEYREALEIRRELAKTNRDAYIGTVAMTLQNVAFLHKNLTRYDEAEQEYQEALEIYRELAKNNHEVSIGHVAQILNNLANLHDVLNRKQEAESEYQEALKIYCELAKSNQVPYIEYVAQTRNNLGTLLLSLNHNNKAVTEFEEALKIYRELAKTNRRAYREMADTLNNLAVLHFKLTRFVEAEKEWKEVEKIYRELAQTNRDAYIEYVAQTLYNLALLQQKFKSRLDEARDAANEALGIYKELANSTPQIWNRYVVKTQLLLEVILNSN